MRISLTVGFVLAIAVSGCIASNPLVGNKNWQISLDARREARAQRAEAAIAACDDAPALGRAEAALEPVTLVLEHDDPLRYPQLVHSYRRALQRYPRLTFPAIVAPEPSLPKRELHRWIVPVVIDRRQAGVSDISATDAANSFSFWLETHGSEAEVDNAAAPHRLDTRCRTLVHEEHEQFLHLVFQVRSTEVLKHGFYDLRILPRVTIKQPSGVDAVGDGLVRALEEAIEEGNWYEADAAIRGMTSALDRVESDRLRAIARSVADAEVPFFAEELDGIAERIHDLSTSKPRDAAIVRAHRAIMRLVNLNESPAPVYLDDAATGRFSFIVAADLQHHESLDAVRRFFATIDPWMERGGMTPQNAVEAKAVPPGEVDEREAATRARDAKFVILAGDLGDSAAGSDVLELIGNFFGVLPPRSPYAHQGRGEFHALRAELMKFRKPVVATPGNHDGYVGFGGLVNNLIDAAALGVREVPIGGTETRKRLAARVHWLSDHFPSLVQWRLLPLLPRYDGLRDWQEHLGPLNAAFNYRTHTFLAFNSYDLDQRERAAAGGVILNWGGGVQDRDVTWMANALWAGRTEPDTGRLFLAMHHDPRGALPTIDSYEEHYFGIYDPIDNLFSFLTFGYFGIGNSPKTGLYIPIVTPGISYLTRTIDIRTSGSGEWQQEWMREPEYSWWDIDEEGYQAIPLIETINSYALAPTRRECEKGGATCHDTDAYLFFGHNDTPLISKWKDRDGTIFRTADRQVSKWCVRDTDCEWPRFKYPTLPFLKYRNDAAHAAARDIDWRQRQRPDTNATVVRLDDIGNVPGSHGFHLVTVEENGPVHIEHIRLPD